MGNKRDLFTFSSKVHNNIKERLNLKKGKKLMEKRKKGQFRL
jgi:hypothetical protein